MGIIKRNEKVAKDHYQMVVCLRADHTKPAPGQFYMLRCGSTTDPLLRRPLSVHGYQGIDGCVSFLYRMAGKGTALLTKMKQGDHLEILGPLGRGFDMPDSIGHALFIAGGIGVAPIPYLIECMKERAPLLTTRILVGARTCEGVLSLERFRELGVDTTVFTEDGTLGKRGCVTDNLALLLREHQATKCMVFACGPASMLEVVANACISSGIPCQVSLDRMMACGVGACLGCVVRGTDISGSNLKGPYRRVCIDGPVFHAIEIQWPIGGGGERCPL